MCSVTTIIPYYNQAQWLPEALQSLLAEQISDHQIIVVDDGSESHEGTAICNNISDAIEYYRIPHAGPSAARNFGLERARGKYIQFLDADDYLVNQKTTRQIAALEASGADVAFSDWTMAWMSFGKRKHLEPTRSLGPSEILLSNLLRRRATPPGNYCYRRASLGTHRFDNNAIINEDFAFIVEFLASGKVPVYVPGLGIIYRRHSRKTLSRLFSTDRHSVFHHLSVARNTIDRIFPLLISKFPNYAPDFCFYYCWLSERYYEFSRNDSTNLFAQAQALDSTCERPPWQHREIKYGSKLTILGYRVYWALHRFANRFRDRTFLDSLLIEIRFRKHHP